MKSVLIESERYVELSSGKPDFVAIAGHLHLMKNGHVDIPLMTPERRAERPAVVRGCLFPHPHSVTQAVG